ncbi:MAG: tyrosine-type recombinase/integrase [Bacteroidales bacterium]|nr:tyrosine-type recombinase/integrase [Bacteroidales bacterium]MCF8457333.1 tyrosine-type recombinase/integrase [Bacteroidales bacterium]
MAKRRKLDYYELLKNYHNGSATDTTTIKASEENEWQEIKQKYRGFLRLEKASAKSTIVTYTNEVDRFGKFWTSHYPTCKIADVSQDIIKHYIHEYVSKLQVNTHIKIIHILKDFFHYLLVEGLVQYNPIALIGTPRKPLKLPNTLNFAEISRILNGLNLETEKGIRDYAIIEVLYATGIRVSELTNLLISNLHLKQGRIVIFGKGRKERVVFIHEKAILALNRYLALRRNGRIQPGNEDYVFLGRWGTQLSIQQVDRIVDVAAKSVGIRKNVHPHIFRHSFATHLVRSGVNLINIMQLLGHADISSTEIYAHLNYTFLKEQLDKYHPRYRGK